MFRNRRIIFGKGEDEENCGYNPLHYSHYRNGRFIIIKYDKIFVALELVAYFLIVLIGLAVYLWGYQTTYNDPIAETKQGFITAQLVAIGISIIGAVLATFFTRSSKENLITNLKLIAILSIIMVVFFMGIKLCMDNQYNANTFEQYYEQYEAPNEEKNTKKLSFELSGIKILEAKEAYIQESLNAYKHFSIKVTLYMIIHIAVAGVIFYLAKRLSKVEENKQELEQVDEILFDEEENVKY